jgi:squalene-hopene/tetraprenyl-beta-curcumene cyclase
MGTLVVVILLGLGVSPDAKALTPPEVAASVERSLPVLEKEGVTWIEQKKCVTCHQVPFMLWSHQAAASRGLKLNQDGLKQWTEWSLEKAETGAVDGLAQLILAIGSYQPDLQPRLIPLGEKLIKEQQPDGSWKSAGQLPAQKRPALETQQVSTLWIVVALDALARQQPAFAEKAQPAIDKALKWLQPLEKPVSLEWSAVRLLAEYRVGDREKAAAMRQNLLTLQRDDGGWGWLTAEPSDALATGQALYVLSQTGSTADDAAVARARAFLLMTQPADGKWLVNGTKTASKGKPQPTSNFWGTGWAVVGLLESSRQQSAAGGQ